MSEVDCTALKAWTTGLIEEASGAASGGRSTNGLKVFSMLKNCDPW